MKKYTKEHEWVEIKGREAVIGITAYAAKELGDITFVEVHPEGTDVIVGDVIGTIESVKAASDVYSPISGTISATNTELEEEPAIVNNSPEEKGWVCKLDNIDLVELEELMTKEQYDKFLKESASSSKK
ncbi:MAG TPA: glycine cleavage system protein GcvH [Lentisphaeria bacterium]|nr:MAG: glycine cleavage system protein H [Lentisphaerae bacterium GWF2_49_21]HBC88340.1 glycine cleavage system protein GcvH [Lentisphaeria bacterium]